MPVSCRISVASSAGYLLRTSHLHVYRTLCGEGKVQIGVRRGEMEHMKFDGFHEE
jgi:hypothetical protein